ncbi:MAG: HAD family phosphatase [Saprospiraceae bacterium]|nr:HAD family phosphatase [Saprospiraceae bacterium]
MTSQPIRNIIFDLGNVLLNIDFNKTRSRLSAVTGLDFNQIDDKTMTVFNKFETGKIPYVVFFNYLTKISRTNAVINDLLPAWNAMLEEMPEGISELLTSLAANYKLFLLSNINETHADWFDRYLEKQGIKKLWYNQIFTRIYYSNIIGRRKPEAECFKFVLEDSNISPSETLFIDDLEENVQAAVATGIQAMQYDRKAETLADFLKNKAGIQW